MLSHGMKRGLVLRSRPHPPGREGGGGVSPYNSMFGLCEQYWTKRLRLTFKRVLITELLSEQRKWVQQLKLTELDRTSLEDGTSLGAD